MSRAGMATLIQLVRAATNAGTADYTIAGTTYWTDDQIQAELDRTMQPYRFVMLEFAPQYNNGGYQWFDYLLPDVLGSTIEAGHSADSGWIVRDTNGGSIDSTTYTVDYEARKITFAADRRGSAIFLDARSYNVYRAASRLWKSKAGHVANQFDWKTDNTEIKGSGQYQQALEMSRYYASLAGPVVSRMFRTDEL
jgi:hypothetical protein